MRILAVSQVHDFGGAQIQNRRQRGLSAPLRCSFSARSPSSPPSRIDPAPASRLCSLCSHRLHWVRRRWRRFCGRRQRRSLHDSHRDLHHSCDDHRQRSVAHRHAHVDSRLKGHMRSTFSVDDTTLAPAAEVIRQVILDLRASLSLSALPHGRSPRSRGPSRTAGSSQSKEARS